MLELAFEAREFLTCPSVDAARLSVTTIETTSCSRNAFTSVPSRTSCPFGAPDRPRGPHLRRLLRPHPFHIGSQRCLGRRGTRPASSLGLLSGNRRGTVRSLKATTMMATATQLRRFMVLPPLRPPAGARPGATATTRTTRPPIFRRTLSAALSTAGPRATASERRIHHGGMLFNNDPVAGTDHRRRRRKLRCPKLWCTERQIPTLPGRPAEPRARSPGMLRDPSPAATACPSEDRRSRETPEPQPEP